MNDNLFCARSHYDYRRQEAQRLWRFLTMSELKALCQGRRMPFLLNDGTVGEVKVTLVKTWKRRDDVEIHWKYGLYEYGSKTYRGDADNMEFCVQVEEELVEQASGEEAQPLETPQEIAEASATEVTSDSTESAAERTRRWATENSADVGLAMFELQSYLKLGACAAFPFNWFALFAETVMAQADGEARRKTAQVVLSTLEEVSNG